MSYEEKQIYKDTKALQWAKEGLVCELGIVGDKLMIADTDEEVKNLLDALKLDIETLIDAINTLNRSKKYYSKEEEQ